MVFVFLLIFATNRIDKINFSRIEESVEKIYLEQILTKDAMIELSQIIHEKEVAYLRNDSVYFSNVAPGMNQRMQELVATSFYENMDRREESVLKSMKEHIERIESMEKQNSFLRGENMPVFHESIRGLTADIHDYAEIQVGNGKRNKLLSRDALASSNLFYQIEIYLLIAIALGIQIAILFPFGSKARTTEE